MFKKICTAFSCLCLNSAAFLTPDLLLQDSNPYHFHWKSPAESLFLQEDCHCYPIQTPRQWIRIRQMKRNKTNHIYMALSSHTTFFKNSVCTWTLNMVMQMCTAQIREHRRQVRRTITWPPALGLLCAKGHLPCIKHHFSHILLVKASYKARLGSKYGKQTPFVDSGEVFVAVFLNTP